jgi:acetyl-CoA acetyltransferase
VTVDIAIAATFGLPPRRYPDLTAKDLYRNVMEGVVREWKVKPGTIDGVLTGPSDQSTGKPDIYPHEAVVNLLGLQPRFMETLNLGGATFAAMAHRAAMAIREGVANAVLCIGAGKFTKPTSGAAEAQAKMIAEPDFEVPYGAFIPAIYALVASRYLAVGGGRREDMARIAVSARRWAMLNPRALMHSKGEISVADVLASRPISAPFHFLDCSVPTDGGGALLVTRADLARQICRQPAYFLGYGEAHTHGTISNAPDLVHTGAETSGALAFKEAELSPADIDMVQIYDAFTCTPLIMLENLGFCEFGGAGALAQSGALDPGGRLPMNTHGGLLSFGHTGDTSGMSVLIEGARQVMGEAGANQQARARTVLTHTYGGMMCDHATLILGQSL